MSYYTISPSAEFSWPIRRISYCLYVVLFRRHAVSRRFFPFGVALGFVTVLSLLGNEVAAEQFRYFDTAGSLHFESDWKDVPKEYRDEAAQNYYRSPQNQFPKQRATESLFEGPTYVPLRPPTVPRGSLRRVWRPRGGYSGIQTTRIP